MLSCVRIGNFKRYPVAFNFSFDKFKWQCWSNSPFMNGVNGVFSVLSLTQISAHGAICLSLISSTITDSGIFIWNSSQNQLLSHFWRIQNSYFGQIWKAFTPIIDFNIENICQHTWNGSLSWLRIVHHIKALLACKWILCQSECSRNNVIHVHSANFHRFVP